MATEPYTCFAIAAPGLEPLVARELTSLGERPRTDAGGVSWEGDARSLMRANLWLRTASRVVVRVASFRATAFHELERRARKIPWATFLGAATQAEFRVTARKSRLYHSDAIAERLATAAAAGTAAGAPARGARGARVQRFVVRVAHDEVTISADSSGDLLHARGYRHAVGKAPLRETLGAALLLASDWPGDTALVDPLCGSGTIPIEAAMLARRMAPGARRRFAFTHWPGFDRHAWDALHRAAVDGERAEAPVPIAGFDRDAGAIASARDNAARAGVAASVQLAVQPISALRATADSGLVVTNPPYGVRVGDASDVRNLYAQFGNVLRHHAMGWRVAMCVQDLRLAKQTGLSLEPVIATTNGGLRVTIVTGVVS